VNLPASFAAVVKEGHLDTTNARTTQDLSPLHAKARSLHVVFILSQLLHGRGRGRHGQIFRSLAMLVDVGKVQPLVDAFRLTLETALGAHRSIGPWTAQGKVDIDVTDVG
jgi:NADPH2:quinone reductase